MDTERALLKENGSDDSNRGDDEPLPEGEHEDDKGQLVCPPLSLKLWRYFFYTLYFLTGQYAYPNTTKKWISVLMTSTYLLFIPMWWPTNILPFVATLVEWIACYSKYYNVCYSIILHTPYNNSTPTAIPDIVLRSVGLSNESDPYKAGSLLEARNELTMFTTYTKITVLVTSFSSMTSYIFFSLAFMKLYIFPHAKKTGRLSDSFIDYLTKGLNLLYFSKKNIKVCPVLHPFNDDDSQTVEVNEADNDTSTQLEWRQAISYYFVLIFNIAINIAMLAVFLFYQYSKPINHHDDSNDGSHQKSLIHRFEIPSVIMYTYSLLSTVFSCFIFSKLAYGIQNKYTNFNKYLEHIDKPVNELKEDDDFIQYLKDTHGRRQKNGNEDLDALYQNMDERHIKVYYIQERDRHFANTAEQTLKVFELWFFLHWILYIISAFLSLSLFLEAFIYRINARLPDHDASRNGIDFQDPELVFLGLFAASNCLFFLYPCIRAAGVTNSRQIQIRHLNNDYNQHRHIDTQLKDDIARFLNSQNAGFDLHILCARVPFSFSVAYISIFIALFSVLLKVATSI